MTVDRNGRHGAGNCAQLMCEYRAGRGDADETAKRSGKSQGRGTDTAMPARQIRDSARSLQRAGTITATKRGGRAAYALSSPASA